MHVNLEYIKENGSTVFYRSHLEYSVHFTF